MAESPPKLNAMSYADMSGSSWFALYSKARHEKQVATILRGKGYPQFLPLYRSRQRHSGRFQDVELPLFPNYVFCHFHPQERLPILTIPGVFFIVGSATGPEPVLDTEIDALRKITALGLRTQPWPFLENGDRVRLVEGPLCGTEGIIQCERGECRLIVSITLLQRSVAVDIDQSWVRSIDSPRLSYMGTDNYTGPSPQFTP